MQETWVRSLGGEDPLEKEMAAYSSNLAWRIPWMEEPGGLQFTGPQRFRHDWATSLSLSFIVIVNLLRSVFCPSMWSILENIACALEKKYVFCFWRKVKWKLLRSVQFSSDTQSSSTLCDPMSCSTPGLPVQHQLPEPTQTQATELVMPSNHLILCRPLLLLPSTVPRIGVFSDESALHIRWPKYWSLSFNISPSNEHPGLISFRIDWLDLLAVQGMLKSLLQHHSSKASTL